MIKKIVIMLFFSLFIFFIHCISNVNIYIEPKNEATECLKKLYKEQDSLTIFRDSLIKEISNEEKLRKRLFQ